MAVTNGWLLYKRQHLLMKNTTKVLSLLQFQAQIASNFILAGKNCPYQENERGRVVKAPRI